ncbi:MAG: tRNA (guanosine(46)-N7)-methyltransferase TrmB, partial [Mollicutes bacterium PWAP]|nr:tRNA (guanosine(46)-N7)-methyltransferase TrmB [Mollicutes bacterium PWAP]
MRLRNNEKYNKQLFESDYLIKDFPFEVNKNVIIELGMGKGEMITLLAKKNPHQMYLGVEKFPTVAAKAMKKAEKLGIKNFKIICEDIKDLPNLLIGNVNTMWLTFSDPWPKSRHDNRRLTYKTFLEYYSLILGKTGILKLKTDNDGFFEWSIESMVKFKANILDITRDLH